MAFKNAVLQEASDLPAGEVIKASPHNVSAFEVFQDGLIEGRFVKFDTGSIDILDASATPVIAGIAKRKITGEIGDGVYSTSGIEIDQVAEVINFGFATVTVQDAAAPSKYDPVYTINLDSAEAGKATQNSGATGAIAVANCVFWEQKADNVWLVRMNQFL
ncbi:hypothetical protein NVP1154O_07 [Vibrio phage 1.154.O._10N.222.52.B12]|nr:hypothetical protein NVP1154O_07 [Vibrio phage 1.154.O._10N.222.52.B12]